MGFVYWDLRVNVFFEKDWMVIIYKDGKYRIILVFYEKLVDFRFFIKVLVKF